MVFFLLLPHYHHFNFLPTDVSSFELLSPHGMMGTDYVLGMEMMRVGGGGSAVMAKD